MMLRTTAGFLFIFVSVSYVRGTEWVIVCVSFLRFIYFVWSDYIGNHIEQILDQLHDGRDCCCLKLVKFNCFFFIVYILFELYKYANFNRKHYHFNSKAVSVRLVFCFVLTVIQIQLENWMQFMFELFFFSI